MKKIYSQSAAVAENHLLFELFILIFLPILHILPMFFVKDIILKSRNMMKSHKIAILKNK